MTPRTIFAVLVLVLLVALPGARPASAQDATRVTALSAKATLTRVEQEELALALFKQMAADTSDKPDVLVTGYTTVIEKCPDTDRAHISYWRLTNVYNQAYDPPKHEEIVRILEQFLARYKTSSVVSMKKYPDQQLVFSPLRSLHNAYEALGRFDRIAAYYDTTVAGKASLGPYDTFDYASALDKVGRAKDAVTFYTQFLAATKGNDDVEFMRELATDRLAELKSRK